VCVCVCVSDPNSCSVMQTDDNGDSSSAAVVCLSLGEN